MLSDEVLEIVSERLIDRIERVNTYILKKMGANIKAIGELSTTDAYQLAQVLKYGGEYEKIVEELSKITKLNEQDIRDIFEEVAKNDYQFAEQFYNYKGVNQIPYDENYTLKNQVEAITNLSVSNLNYMSKPTMLGYGMIDTTTGQIVYKGLQQAYFDLIDEAVFSIAQGKETFNEVMSRQIEQMGGGGLKTIYNSTYVNKDGEIINRSRRLDSTVRMNIKDGLRSLHNETQNILGREFGADGVEISVHNNPAPDHQDAQGRQFSKEEYNKLQETGIAKDYDGKEIDISSTSKKGHTSHRPISQYNCYHYIFNIVLGVSGKEYTDKQLQEIIDNNNEGFEFDGKQYTNYEGTQLQRRIETEIRKQKDIQIMAKASGQIDTVEQAQSKITQLTRKYNDLSNVSGLPTKIDRMKVSNYRRVNISKAR